MNIIRIFITVIIVGFMLSACNTKRDVQIPAGILPEDTLVQVMVDMQLLESAISIGLVNTNMKPINDTLQMYNIFKKNGIRKLRYDESMKFYAQYPELLGSIYDRVINELSKKQAEEANK